MEENTFGPGGSDRLRPTENKTHKMPNKTVLDKRLPAPSRNDFRSYNHQPQVDGAPPVGAARPQTLAQKYVYNPPFPSSWRSLVSDHILF
jgi:hypothetical protein